MTQKNILDKIVHMRHTNTSNHEYIAKYIQFYPKCMYLKEELALSLWTVNPDECLQLLDSIVTDDEQLMRRICFNTQQLLQNRKQNQDFFSPQTVVLNSVPVITFSITTCKRLDLFTSTMNAFTTHFKDHRLFCRWLCVDDNSPDDERLIMKERFPFMEFIWKSNKDVGHAISMQMIAEKVNTPFLIHIEDDRVLLHGKCFIPDMIEILESDENIGQVVFNHNYAETLNDDIKGGLLCKTESGVFYYTHEYVVTEQERKNWLRKYGNCRNANYYPHFSLSPSMIKTSIFKELTFKNVVSFEYAFALEYSSLNYKTVFLPGFYFEHRGRLTSEINDLNIFNAYDLNETEQFTTQTKYKTFLINLDRRKDRMSMIHEHINLYPKFERFSGIDGKDMTNKKEKINNIFALCKHGDYYMRTGVVGCALSHLKLLTQLIQDNVDGYLIMEDDVVFTENAKHKIDRTFRILELGGLAINLLFFSIVPKHHHEEKSVIVSKTYEEACEFSVGGTGCYYISKKFANVVVEYVNDNGIDCPIDVILYRLLDHVTGYFTLPPFVSQTGSLSSDVLETTSFHMCDVPEPSEPCSFKTALQEILLGI